MSQAPSTAAAPKRPRLTFSLRTFMVVTLALSLVLGYFGRVWLKAYRDRQPPTLSELAQVAKRHGIPMPPPGAKLVLAKGDLRRVGSQTFQLYTPAFLISPDSDEHVVVLCGENELELHSADQGVPLYVDFSADPGRGTRKPCAVSWSDDSTLLTAIQLADRGDHARAEAVLNNWIESAQRQGILRARGPRGGVHGLRDRVREIAYERLVQELYEEERAKWPEIAARLSRLMEESESLRRDHAQLVADLSLTLGSPQPASSSVEGMLVGGRSNLFLRRGFEVVPELIRLCEDRRMTRPMSDYSRNDDRFEHLGDLARSALIGISGYHPGQALSVDMPDDINDLDAAFWNDWWRQAEAQGERDYYVRNFFAISRYDFTARQVAAEVLASKHRDALIRIGEEYLAVAPSSVPRLQMAQAIKALDLRPETKTEMLSNIAQHCPPLERRAVLREMADLDPKPAAELLIQLFDELPADTRGFGQEPSMNTFPKMDLILSQPKLSRAYLAAARRNKSLRMELISRLAYWYASDQELPGRLALLSALLDDETPRDRSLPSERFFSDDFAGITVRDFAAMHSAKLLEIDVQPNGDWTPEQWSALRDQVRERLKQEKLPVLE